MHSRRIKPSCPIEFTRSFSIGFIALFAVALAAGGCASTHPKEQDLSPAAARRAAHQDMASGQPKLYVGTPQGIYEVRNGRNASSAKPARRAFRMTPATAAYSTAYDEEIIKLMSEVQDAKHKRKKE